MSLLQMDLETTRDLFQRTLEARLVRALKADGRHEVASIIATELTELRTIIMDTRRLVQNTAMKPKEAP